MFSKVERSSYPSPAYKRIKYFLQAYHKYAISNSIDTSNSIDLAERQYFEVDELDPDHLRTKVLLARRGKDGEKE